MPKLSEFAQNGTTTLLLSGSSGTGKSVFAAYAPLPQIRLMFDKDTPKLVPGVDPEQVFYKAYPPAEADITQAKHLPPRNVFDGLLADVMAIKNHFIKKTPLKIDGANEWPTPATVIVEGGSPIAEHALNWVMNVNGKMTLDDFKSADGKVNRYAPYQQRLTKLNNDLYEVLTRIPCNIIVCTSVAEDKDDSGKGNGIFRPELGGKLNNGGPLKFESSLLTICTSGKYYVQTQNDHRFIGYKVNTFGVAPKVEVTIAGGKNPIIDMWKVLLNATP